MHLNGVIHCNIKPTNIILDEYGNVKICDFKKALKVNEMTIEDIKKNKAAMTPCYTAPELFSDERAYSFKSNLWALGCIMYEMAVGRVQFLDEAVNRLIGIIEHIFILMKDNKYYSNLNLIKIMIKLIEANDTKFNDIISMNLIDKVNYMISKDTIDDITIYTEYIIEMLFDLMFKLNEYTKTKYSKNIDKNEYRSNFISKISKIVVNFKLCIKYLCCDTH